MPYESTHKYGDSQTLYLKAHAAIRLMNAVFGRSASHVIYGSMILNSVDWPDCFIQFQELPEQHTASQGKSEDLLSWPGRDWQTAE